MGVVGRWRAIAWRGPVSSSSLPVGRLSPVTTSAWEREPGRSLGWLLVGGVELPRLVGLVGLGGLAELPPGGTGAILANVSPVVALMAAIQPDVVSTSLFPPGGWVEGLTPVLELQPFWRHLLA
jgi:hypothetical protein